jgi:transposase
MSYYRLLEGFEEIVEYPNKEQETLLRKTLGSARFVWNYFLDLRQKSWKQENKSLSYYDTAKILTQLKKEPEYSWLSEVSIIPLRYSIYDLDGTYKKFFKEIVVIQTSRKSLEPILLDLILLHFPLRMVSSLLPRTNNH